MARLSTSNMPGYAMVFASLAFFAGLPAYGQVPVDDYGNPLVSLDNAESESAIEFYESDSEPLTPVELETLVGPIALYPDDLLAIVLPASTYPLQIVQAARFLEAYESDHSLEPDESWDESVVALINYPEVIQLLNDDIDWTWQLGEAVIAQQQDIINAVESFRNRAYAAGNLKSDEHQTVTRDADIIEIDPIEDDVIYVPYYEPERVVIRQPQRVYYYYDRACPVYYYPYPTGYAFSSGYFWGVTTAYRIGWASNHLRVHHSSYWGHPYYGHSYYGHYYRRSSITVHNTVYVNNARRYSPQRLRDGDYWRPRRHVGARPSDYYLHTRHYRSDVRRARHGANHNTDQRNDRRNNRRNNRRDHDADRTRTRAQNEIRFRRRDRLDSVRARREQNHRSIATRLQNRSQTALLARSSEPNRHSDRNDRSVRQTTRDNDRGRHQVRQTPPQRRVNGEANTQRPQRQARNEQNRPRRQQPPRVQRSPVHQLRRNQEAPERQARRESNRQHDDKSQHRRQQQIKEDRAPSRKSGRSERGSGGDRKVRAAGRRERHTRSSQ